MAKVSVGNVFWNLRADGTELPKDVERAINRSKKSMERMGRSFKDVGQKLALGVTAPITGLGIASLKMSSDFDDAMREVNSLIGLPTEGFKDLKNEIRETTSELGLGLADGAAAAYQAISAGIPREELTSFLRVAGQSAVAGVSDLETAVGLLTKSMDSYGDKSVSVTELSDQLFATVKGGVTNFEELAAALPNATGMAASLGVESNELLGILARTTKVSESTSGAVTRIAAAMGALMKPTGDMEKLFEAAGIESAKTEIEANGLTETLLKLRKAAKGNETVIAKAFGRKEAILLMSDLALNTDAWRENIDAVTNSSGSMNAAFEEIDKGPGRAFAKLKAEASSLAVQIGDVLMPALLPVVTSISGIVSKLGDLDPGFVRIGVAIAGVAAAVGPLMIGLGVVTSSMSGLIPIIAGVGGGAGGLAGIFGAVAGILTGPVAIAIAGIVAGGILIVKNWDTVKSFLTSAASAIASAFDSWRERNAGTLASIGASWESIRKSAGTIFGAISEWVVATTVKMDGMLEPIGGLRGAWENLKIVVSGAVNLIGDVIGMVFGNIALAFENLAAVVTGQKSIWQAWKDTVGGIISSAIDVIKTNFNEAVTWLKTLPPKMLQIGGDIIQGLADGIRGAAMAPVNAIKDAGQGVIDGAKGLLGIQSPSTVFREIGEFILDGLTLGLINTSGPEAAAASAAAKVKSSFRAGFAGATLGAVTVAGATVGTGDLSDPGSSILQSERARQEQLNRIEQRGLQRRIDMNREFFGTLSGLMYSENKKLASIGKAAAIAQATIDAYVGANKALASFPPPFNYIAAAGVIAQGMSNVAMIRSQGAFADGGDFVGGRAMLVGEQGPEMIVPRSQGRVLTAEETAGVRGGGTTINITQNFSDANPERLAEVAGEIEERSKRGVIDAISNQGPERDVIRGV